MLQGRGVQRAQQAVQVRLNCRLTESRRYTDIGSGGHRHCACQSSSLRWFFAPAVHCQDGSDLIQKYEQQIQANPANSRAHYELGEIYLEQGGYINAANEYHAALNGDFEPKLIEVLSHLGLAKAFERSRQAERVANEREQAARAARDNPRLAEATSTASDSVQPSTSSPSAPRPRLLSPIVLTPPPPIRQTEPEYSDKARAAGLEGTIQVGLNIAPDGTAVNEKV
jgi:tetratricopeptide (TPR) repeat protein